MNDRFKFRAFYQGRFIYKSLTDANYYDKDNKCIGLANTLPNNLKWEQSTGLKDKNGKLIFEGDIIKEWFGETGTYQVIYENSTASFIFSNLNDEDYDYDLRQNPDLFPDQDLEIIGNIHENPELLKAS